MIREFREKPTISLNKTIDDNSLRNLEGADEVYLNSSVDTVPRLRAGWLKKCGTIPNRARNFLFAKASKRITELTHLPIMKDWGVFLGEKGAGCEVDH